MVSPLSNDLGDESADHSEKDRAADVIVACGVPGFSLAQANTSQLETPYAESSSVKKLLLMRAAISSLLIAGAAPAADMPVKASTARGVIAWLDRAIQ